MTHDERKMIDEVGRQLDLLSRQVDRITGAVRRDPYRDIVAEIIDNLGARTGRHKKGEDDQVIYTRDGVALAKREDAPRLYEQIQGWEATQ